MGTVRYFGGSRGDNTKNPAIDLKKLEILKKGKLPANIRYKYILKKKQEAKMGINTDSLGNYKKLLGQSLEQFDKTSKVTGRKSSKRALQALREMAMKKAAKENKALRQMVVVQRQNFHNGSVDAKGRIYDVASNQVGQVNLKNGRMAAMNGWAIGKYKAKSVRTNLAIQDAINKYSPYYINLRKMQQMQQTQGMGTQEVINLYGFGGNNTNPTGESQGLDQYYGSNIAGPRQNIGMTSWGAMSNNAWGTFTDNAWGTVSDNAWGTASTDVWGGISVGGLWGDKGARVWGTGSGKNYLRGAINFVITLFGFNPKIKGARDAKREFFAQNRQARRNGGSTVVRSSAPTRR